MKNSQLFSFLSLLTISFTFTLFMSDYGLKALEVNNSYYKQHKIDHSQHQKILDKDLDFMTNLGLIKGHLMLGKELLVLGEYEQAEPHFGHPVDEIYGNLEPELEARNILSFKTELTILHDLVKFSPQDNKVMSQYDQAMVKIDEAISNLSVEKRNNSEFISQVIKNLLATVKEEYSAAIIGNKVVENVEYQDSRGFVLYSLILYENMDNNSPLKAKMQPILFQIKDAFPQAIPPETIIFSSEKMEQLVNNFPVN
ncbi:hypothetical protein [Geminocystis sp. NIES-3709]|uniref:hypothetical protein n=1 Tax=Geminocystis sp. NIES-3709 TaxID=1617448 RepID=UPI0005FC752B|nr:hypothetical protein [Geminocystis sp. NIES-3709]BAQ63689.1 hypothetical protein GM3709_454 [Geminocystis sp. NIES-3709]